MPSSSDTGAGPRPAFGREPPARVQAAASRLPLYRALADRSLRHSHTAEDLQAIVDELGDPFGGRHDDRHPPVALPQVARDQPLFWALSSDDLNAMARLIAGAWSRLGIGAGSGVAFYDYATSPCVLYASRSYIAHLDAGAADILGCVPICNDGLPELADRCRHILEYVDPAVLFVDGELVGPLRRALDRSPMTKRPANVVITSDEAVVDPAQLEEWRRALGTDVTQMLRVDGALLLAPPCSTASMTFHPDDGGYLVETSNLEGAADNRITVTNLAIRSSVVVRYVTELIGEVHEGTCPCGHTGTRVTIDAAG